MPLVNNTTKERILRMAENVSFQQQIDINIVQFHFHLPL